jgi:hypothetical protein
MAQDPLARRVQALRERVVLVQAGAIGADDELRSGRVERLALEPFDLLAAHVAVRGDGRPEGLRARPA